MTGAQHRKLGAAERLKRLGEALAAVPCLSCETTHGVSPWAPERPGFVEPRILRHRRQMLDPRRSMYVIRGYAQFVPSQLAAQRAAGIPPRLRTYRVTFPVRHGTHAEIIVGPHYRVRRVLDCEGRHGRLCAACLRAESEDQGPWSRA